VVFYREKSERKASWTELFYDLIFVAVISKLTHVLARHPEGWLEFLIFYTALWRVWLQTMLYSSRYDTGDLVHKILYYVQVRCFLIEPYRLLANLRILDVLLDPDGLEH